ncbi:hypothetical protein VTO42DRAFT_2832 [Malbranchea cinnamomea]
MSSAGLSYSDAALLIVPALVGIFFALTIAAAPPPAPPRGCRRVGIPSGKPSNLADEQEYDVRGLRRGTAQGSINNKNNKKIRIKALFSYPIKSCAPIEWDAANFDVTGLPYDRQFCFAEYVDRPLQDDGADSSPSDKTTTAAAAAAAAAATPRGRWDARTLRDGKFSRMTLIRPEIWVPDPSSLTYSPDLPEVRSNGVMVVHFPRQTRNVFIKLAMALRVVPDEESFAVPLDPPADENRYPRLPVRIFKQVTAGVSYATHVPPSLARFLGTTRPLSLFRSLPTDRRYVRGNSVGLEAELGFDPTIAYSDEYPLQMQNLGSVRAIAEKVRGAIPRFTVRRFRPNVVLEGCAAFQEDDWKKIRLVAERPTAGSRGADGKEDHDRKDDEAWGGGMLVHVCCRTVRCRLPNVDPDTGIRHPVEPDKTLRATRNIDTGAPGAGCLGMMLVPASTNFTLHVGDTVEVLETGKHHYTKGH